MPASWDSCRAQPSHAAVVKRCRMPDRLVLQGGTSTAAGLMRGAARRCRQLMGMCGQELPSALS